MIPVILEKIKLIHLHKLPALFLHNKTMDSIKSLKFNLQIYAQILQIVLLILL